MTSGEAFHYPFTRESSILENLRMLPWCHDQNLLKAWRHGRTGYPIVDAGQRAQCTYKIHADLPMFSLCPLSAV